MTSSFRLLTAKSSVSVFGKDNAKKDRRDDPETIRVDKNARARAANPDIKIDADVGVDNPGTVADNLSIAANNSSIVIDDPNIAGDNLGIANDN